MAPLLVSWLLGADRGLLESPRHSPEQVHPLPPEELHGLRLHEIDLLQHLLPCLFL